MDYTAIELKVEADMVRTALEPVAGSYWLDFEEGVGAAKKGRCCLLSPQLLGVQIDGGDDLLQLIVEKLDVPRVWGLGVIHGFDSGEPLLGADEHYLAGYDFGQRMREKYVQ